MLDLSSLQKATAQLAEALTLAESDLTKENPRLRLHLRAAAIQAFEFTYELCIKMLRRFLAGSEPNQREIDELTFNELIRLGYARGLLRSELTVWRRLRANRGATSHVCDERKAEEVYATLAGFLEEALSLASELHQRQERSG